MAVKPIPEGCHTVTPYFVVEGAAELIDFVKQAFDGEEIMRMPGPDGRIGHAEMRIGSSMVMLADAGGENQPTQTLIHLYVDDVDKVYQRALEAGATLEREPADQFYGDRSAGVRDRFGNQWYMATHVEDVPEDEMARRAEEWAKQQG